jgi:hypothetical protein
MPTKNSQEKPSRIPAKLAELLQTAVVKGEPYLMTRGDHRFDQENPWDHFVEEAARNLTNPDVPMSEREELIKELLDHPALPKGENEGLRWGHDLLLVAILHKKGGTETADLLIKHGFPALSIEPVDMWCLADAGQEGVLKWMHKRGMDICHQSSPLLAHRSIGILLSKHEEAGKAAAEWYPLKHLEEVAEVIANWPVNQDTLLSEKEAEERAAAVRKIRGRRMRELVHSTKTVESISI